MIETILGVLEGVGGRTRAAELAGVGVPATYNWETRGFIPADLFAIFSDELSRRGLSVSRSVFGFKSVEAA